MRKKLFDELVESVKEMRAIERGDAKPARRYVAADILGAERAALLEARRNTGLSQGKFAALLDVSTRTLQDWEQGRREPTGAARTLIRVAARYPKEVLAVTRDSRKVVREKPIEPYATAAGKVATPAKSVRPASAGKPKRAAKG